MSWIFTGFSRPEEILELYNCQTTALYYLFFEIFLYIYLKIYYIILAYKVYFLSTFIKNYYSIFPFLMLKYIKILGKEQ